MADLECYEGNGRFFVDADMTDDAEPELLDLDADLVDELSRWPVDESKRRDAENLLRGHLADLIRTADTPEGREHAARVADVLVLKGRKPEFWDNAARILVFDFSEAVTREDEGSAAPDRFVSPPGLLDATQALTIYGAFYEHE